MGIEHAPVFSHWAAAPADPLTERTRRIWSAGDYDRISAGFRDEAEAFVSRTSRTCSR
jgi:hypothetical protein